MNKIVSMLGIIVFAVVTVFAADKPAKDTREEA